MKKNVHDGLNLEHYDMLHVLQCSIVPLGSKKGPINFILFVYFLSLCMCTALLDVLGSFCTFALQAETWNVACVVSTVFI